MATFWLGNTELDLAGYNVYRSTTSGFSPAPANRIASGIAGASYADAVGIATGTTYYYVVNAVSGSSASADSGQATVLPVAAPKRSATSRARSRFTSGCRSSRRPPPMTS